LDFDQYQASTLSLDWFNRHISVHTWMMNAVYYNHLDMVEEPLRRGADVTFISSWGDSVAHIACFSRVSLEVFDAVVEALFALLGGFPC
jgi:hypothetical protein